MGEMEEIGLEDVVTDMVGVGRVSLRGGRFEGDLLERGGGRC